MNADNTKLNRAAWLALDSFEITHGIWTCYAFGRWHAIKLDLDRREHPIKTMKRDRESLLASKLMATGDSCLDAVKNLCAGLGIECKL